VLPVGESLGRHVQHGIDCAASAKTRTQQVLLARKQEGLATSTNTGWFTEAFEVDLDTNKASRWIADLAFAVAASSGRGGRAISWGRRLAPHRAAGAHCGQPKVIRLQGTVVVLKLAARETSAR
jgi:hypothetical protein